MSSASLLDDSTKDDEERRLESMLFGTPYVPSTRGDVAVKDILIVSDEEDDAAGVSTNELGAVLDADVSHNLPPIWQTRNAVVAVYGRRSRHEYSTWRGTVYGY